MTGEQAVNQNVSFYPTDIAILEEVQMRHGQTFSGALRFIVREWARNNGLLESPHTAATQPQSNKPSAIKSSVRSRAKARKLNPDTSAGVKRGVKSE